MQYKQTFSADREVTVQHSEEFHSPPLDVGTLFLELRQKKIVEKAV